MRVSIVGSGWVGTAIGKGLAKMGNYVIFHDIVDKELPNFTKNIEEAVKNSDISFICVPTPTKENGEIDLSYVENASESIGNVLAEKEDYHLVVVKSTVIPGTTESVVIPALERSSGKKCGEDFGVCMNPEFLTEIEHTWTQNLTFKKDFFTEVRIVIGEYDKKSGDMFESMNADAAFLTFEVENPRMYGVVEGEEVEEGVFKVKRVVEKPEKPPSSIAILPVYVFKPIIFRALEKIPRGKGGEKQLTDGIQKLIEWGFSVYAVELGDDERRLDIGTPEFYAEALYLSGKWAGVL